MHGLQDGASIVSILLKPLLADGVGTAALRRAEESLGGLSATSLDLFSPDSRCRPQDLEAQVAKYTCPVRTLYLFSDVLPVEAKLCMSSEIWSSALGFAALIVALARLANAAGRASARSRKARTPRQRMTLQRTVLSRQPRRNAVGGPERWSSKRRRHLKATKVRMVPTPRTPKADVSAHIPYPSSGGLPAGSSRAPCKAKSAGMSGKARK